MIQIAQVNDLGDDVLEVNGFDDSDPTTNIKATGWISATTNFYPPDQYAKDGHLIPNATKRSMTDGEKQDYWLSLLEPQSTIATPTVLFTNPTAMAVQDEAIITQADDINEEVADEPAKS